jgi:hypothetical protein
MEYNTSRLSSAEVGETASREGDLSLLLVPLRSAQLVVASEQKDEAVTVGVTEHAQE